MNVFVVFRGRDLIAVCLSREEADAIAHKNAYETVKTQWANRIDTATVQRPMYVKEVPVGKAFEGVAGID